MKKRIWFIGDLHGQTLPIKNFYKKYHKDFTFSQETDIMVCLGDFGGNFFFNYRDRNFKKELSKYNLTFFVVRGNHEERPSICKQKNPEDWIFENFFGNFVYVEKKFPYIKYALDSCAEYDIEGFRTLIIPGAYSVDKDFRLAKGWTWFEQEQLTKEEMLDGIKLIEQDPSFDLVLSHTCPKNWQPFDLFLSSVDQKTVDDSMEIFLNDVANKISFQVWLWGHYHQFRKMPRKNDLNSTPSFFDPKKIMLSDGKEVLFLDELFE